MNQLFDGNSIDERGTLCQLKADFQHRNVGKDVMNRFNDVDNFIRFVTEAHIVYLAMDILKMEKITDKPTSSNQTGNKDERTSYIDQLCQDILKIIWLLPTAAEISSVLEADCNLEGNFNRCIFQTNSDNLLHFEIYSSSVLIWPYVCVDPVCRCWMWIYSEMQHFHIRKPNTV